VGQSGLGSGGGVLVKDSLRHRSINQFLRFEILFFGVSFVVRAHRLMKLFYTRSDFTSY